MDALVRCEKCGVDRIHFILNGKMVCGFCLKSQIATTSVNATEPAKEGVDVSV